ncbi:MBL fold metallo-hydrolase [Candidatus Heimdallarchaeota archaeon]|nr:MAG: MBL fold metallo-hydrolase [Candidatus Heimdallarchaeota archaeon]
MESAVLDFESDYFTLFKLQEGVYSAIAKNHTITGANAGFFDLGDYVIVFDTMSAPKATQDLIKGAKFCCKKEIRLVINSHFHGDHIYGNHAISPSIPIIGTHDTVKMINEHTFENLANYQKNARKEIKKLDNQLKTESNPAVLFEINSDLDFLLTISEHGFNLRLPDLIFQKELTIHGSKRSVQIIDVGAAHSISDTIAYLPNDNICFMGDLLFENVDPSWVDKKSVMPFAVNPKNHLKVLKKYSDLNIKYAIPGHGKLSPSPIVFKSNIEFLRLKYPDAFS